MGRFLTPDAYIESIYSISPEGLKKHGIKGLILDIDNTLVPTYTKDADIKVKAFLDDMKKSGIKTAIVSNARQGRVEQFCRHLDVEYFYKALKPFKKGYLKAVESMGLRPCEAAIAGDQLFTDILGGNLVGMKTLLIKPIDFNEPFPVRIKRLLEKPFLRGKQYLDKF
ncbi:MAG TPA: YqeG family HAD IIIA-type phosphatase [Sedimentibacter sp.]|nr:YqeG family HAD IIIA-type phosphatase [Sedimentibacter sp.]